MCASDLETYYEEENYKEIKKINISAQILNKKRKRITSNKKSDDYLNEFEEINSNDSFNNNEDDKINEINKYNINNNKEINFNNYLYVGCDDGSVKIIEINNDSFVRRFFN